MTRLRYTLVSEGTSDAILIPVLDWLLHSHLEDLEIESYHADFSKAIPRPDGLVERIQTAIHLYPCDLLFIHRDADAEDGYTARHAELETALGGLNLEPAIQRIFVIPVQESEAWFLFSEKAIRIAAGYREGRMPLHLPRLRKLETVANPKEKLKEALVAASGRTGRSLKKFDVNSSKRKLAEAIDDFAPLRELPAFQALEQEVQEYCDRIRSGLREATSE